MRAAGIANSSPLDLVRCSSVGNLIHEACGDLFLDLFKRNLLCFDPRARSVDYDGYLAFDVASHLSVAWRLCGAKLHW